jgi:hypothetical protein
MSEKVWNSIDNPYAMIRYPGVRLSARKQRLLTVVFARRVVPLLSDVALANRCLAVAERYADRLAKRNELQEVHDQTTKNCLMRPDGQGILLTSIMENFRSSQGWTVIADACHPTKRKYIDGCVMMVAAVVSSQFIPQSLTMEDIIQNSESREVWAAALKAEQAVQVELVRDVLGNPFRSVALAATTRNSTVHSLALSAYDSRPEPGAPLDAMRLAVLADALEEAGASSEITAHLRQPTPHVRGCWVVDLCLGRT